MTLSTILSRESVQINYNYYYDHFWGQTYVPLYVGVSMGFS